MHEAEQLAAQFQLANDLLDVGLNGPALQHLRQWLRHPEMVSSVVAAGENVALIRGFLVDRVCRAIAADRSPEQEAAALDYFRGTGDLIDPAPDDASSLS